MFIIVIAIILVCLLLGLIVLIQNPKGGGLDSQIGTIGTNIAGAKNSTETVEKWTWYLAAALIVLSLGSARFLENTVQAVEEPAATETPAQPAQGEAPAQQGGAPAQQPAAPAQPAQ